MASLFAFIDLFSLDSRKEANPLLSFLFLSLFSLSQTLNSEDTQVRIQNREVDTQVKAIHNNKVILTKAIQTKVIQIKAIQETSKEVTVEVVTKLQDR